MKAIIVVDCQNDFSTTGTLPINGGTELAYKIYNFVNNLNRSEYKIIFSRDWHPTKHISFNKWPAHCIQNTIGAQYITPLEKLNKDLELLKGTIRNCDSYSVFYKNYFKSKLNKYLRLHNIDDIYVCGLAKDICVLNTANDGIRLNYNTYILSDLTLAINDKIYIDNINKKVIEIESKQLI